MDERDDSRMPALVILRGSRSVVVDVADFRCSVSSLGYCHSFSSQRCDSCRHST